MAHKKVDALQLQKTAVDITTMMQPAEAYAHGGRAQFVLSLNAAEATTQSQSSIQQCRCSCLHKIQEGHHMCRKPYP